MPDRATPNRGQILQELANRGQLPEQYQTEYEQLRTSGGIAPKGGYKPLPDSVATKLEQQVNAYAGLEGSLNSFNDDFSGPGSNIENAAQGVLGTGTSGQRDWWAAFRANDNVIRNDLFGASLTPNEQAAFAATSITPNMKAEEIRANLTRRRDLARDVLGRRAAFARSNGYTPDAVNAILGEYDPAKAAAPGGNDGTRLVGGFADELPDDPMTKLSPDDTRAYFQLERTAKTPGELVGFMADRGFQMDIANAKAIIDSRNKGADLRGRGEVLYEKPRPVDLNDGATGAALRGLGDAATFGFLDELGGVVDTIGGAGGEGSFTERLGRNIDYNRAVLANDEQDHALARFGGQMAGGAAIPLGAGARTAGQLARTGAMAGGLYGLGSGEGDALARVPSAAGGAIVGGAGGYAFGRAAPYLGRAAAAVLPGASSSRVQAHALAEAGERQGVLMNAGDLRPGARNALAYLEASPGSAGPVQNALAAGDQSLEAAVGRVSPGTPQPAEAIGTMAQEAGRRAIEWSRRRKDDLYDRAQRLAGHATVRSQGALDVLEQNISELSQTPNANRALLSLLTDMREDLTDQNGAPRALAIQAVRNLRTAMRGEIGSRNLTMTDAERRVSEVIDAASADITAGLHATDPRAAAAFQQADRFYAERQDYIRNVIHHYTGPRDAPISGEQAYARIMQLTGERGDRQKLERVMQGLSADERADVAATVAGQLGRRVADDDFSPARFVTQAEKITPAAREVVFGTSGAEAINDLIRIATAKRDMGNSLNRSRSGQVSNYDRWLTGVLGLAGAGGGYAAGGAAGAVAGAVGASAAKAGALNLSARLLTNPRFVQWLGSAPRNPTPSQITGHIRRLSELAIKQPMVRGEIQQLQRYLGETGTARSLASEGGEEDEQQRNR